MWGFWFFWGWIFLILVGPSRVLQWFWWEKSHWEEMLWSCYQVIPVEVYCRWRFWNWSFTFSFFGTCLVSGKRCSWTTTCLGYVHESLQCGGVASFDCYHLTLVTVFLVGPKTKKPKKLVSCYMLVDFCNIFVTWMLQSCWVDFGEISVTFYWKWEDFVESKQVDEFSICLNKEIFVISQGPLHGQMWYL